MKSCLLFIAASIAFTTVSNAQITKGSLLLGGELSGNTSKTSYTNDPDVTRKLSSVIFTPAVGKAIRQNLVLGGNLHFGYGEEKNQPTGYQQKMNSYGGGVFIRKYHQLGKSDFYIFLHGGLNVIYDKIDQESTAPVTYENHTKTLTATITAYPGISYALTKKFHLEASFNNLIGLSYANSRTNGGPGTGTQKTNSFGFSSSLNNQTPNFSVGFRVILGK